MQFQKVNRLAYVNFLRAKYETLTGEVLVKSYPYYLGIDPSSICQLRCPGCPTGVENERRKAGEPLTFRNRTMLGVELFDALLDEVGEYLFLIMFYNWGEPLLNKSLPTFIRKAKGLHIFTEIHTNLSLQLSDEYIEDLLGSGVDDLAASIDGFSQESYQTYRRGGNFELAKSNLERLVKARDTLGLKTNIIWNFLVYSFNEHEIPSVRRYCEEWGILFNPREAFIANPEWLPSHRKGELTKSKSSAGEEAVLTQPQKSWSASPCAWHYSYSMVNADGAISPCCAPWDQKHDFGTVIPGLVSFADIWNNNLYRKSRAVFAHKEIKGLDKVDTLCLQCPFGEGLQKWYSHFDVEVINQSNRVFNSSDPLLEQAFSLLDDKAGFVEFFEKNLSNGFGDAKTSSPKRSLGGVVKKLIRPLTRIIHEVRS